MSFITSDPIQAIFPTPQRPSVEVAQPSTRHERDPESHQCPAGHVQMDFCLDRMRGFAFLVWPELCTKDTKM